MHVGVAFFFPFSSPLLDCGGGREVVCVHYHMLVLPSFGGGGDFSVYLTWVQVGYSKTLILVYLTWVQVGYPKTLI